MLGEDGLVDFEQDLLVVHEQVQDVHFVSMREVVYADFAFYLIRQLNKRLLKLLLLSLMELDTAPLVLLVLDLGLVPPPHDLLPHLVYTVHKDLLQLRLVGSLVDLDPLSYDALSSLLLLSFAGFLDPVHVACLQGFYIELDFFLDLVSGEGRGEEQVDEFLEFYVFCRDIVVFSGLLPQGRLRLGF